MMSAKPSENSEEIAETKYCVGKQLLEIGTNDDALASLEDALQVKAKLPEDNILSAASILYCQCRSKKIQ